MAVVTCLPVSVGYTHRRWRSGFAAFSTRETRRCSDEGSDLKIQSLVQFVFSDMSFCADRKDCDGDLISRSEPFQRPFDVMMSHRV